MCKLCGLPSRLENTCESCYVEFELNRKVGERLSDLIEFTERSWNLKKKESNHGKEGYSYEQA